ncbi:MAG TPA: P-II family nitrogen regulator [Thermodesulfovibrionales bacterium]|nr:P-II family nitrogen regulator [Thermodesulfovibrionales bacterium]
MKLVNAVVRTTSLERIVKSLETLGIRQLTILEIKGVGEQAQVFTSYSVYKMIQMIIPDESVNEISSVILDNAHTGLAGDGYIAVLPIESLIDIQTMEKIG